MIVVPCVMVVNVDGDSSEAADAVKCEVKLEMWIVEDCRNSVRPSMAIE